MLRRLLACSPPLSLSLSQSLVSHIQLVSDSFQFLLKNIKSVLNKAYDKQNNSEKKGLEEEKEKLYKKRKEKDEEVQAIYNAFLDEKKVFEANQKLWDEFIKEEKKARSEGEKDVVK